MNRKLLTLTGLIMGLLASSEGAAQWNVARYATERNRIYTSFGLDPALVTAVGYGRTAPFLGREWLLSAEGGIGAAGFETDDFRARIGVQSTIVGWRALRLTGSAAFITRGTKNSIYRGLNFGSDFSATAGVYKRGWFAAAEGGFDKAIITHITHTAWYRDYFYPDAKDGWYLNAGGTWHYGVTTGVSMGRAELAVRAGFRRSETWREVNPPMYGGLGVGWAF